MASPVTPDASDDPWNLFSEWYESAVQCGVPLPEAMTLATVGLDGRPAARVVLYKGRSGSGLRFFTNYLSRKGKELERCPYAALVFHWASEGHQVRIEGSIEKLAPEESDRYFATRPRESQLGAWASPQSEPVESRSALDDKLRLIAERFAVGSVPRPPHWGGYRLVPASFEFWTASEHRLNERWLFTRTGSVWRRSLLGP